MAVVCNLLIYTYILKIDHKHLRFRRLQNLANSTVLLGKLRILLLYCQCSIRLGT
jgi:hypothetical protein